MKLFRGSVKQAATIVIATSTTISLAVNSDSYAMFGLVVPSTFDGTTITFSVSADGTTYQDLYDTTNTQVAMTVGASKSYDLPTALASCPFFKIVCGSAQTTTNTNFVVVKKG